MNTKFPLRLLLIIRRSFMCMVQHGLKTPYTLDMSNAVSFLSFSVKPVTIKILTFLKFRACLHGGVGPPGIVGEVTRL